MIVQYNLAVKAPPPQLILAVLQAVFILAIWLPNLAYLAEYAPIVCNESRLKAEIRTHPFAFPDFLKYYVCADLARQGLKEQIWNPSSQKDWIEKYLEADLPEAEKHKVVLQGIGEYTPAFVMLMIPFTYLPFNLALILWLIFNFLVLILTVTKVLETNATLPRNQIALWWLFMLATCPCWFNFFLGQSSALVTGLTAIFYVCWLKKKSLPAGVSMTLIAVIKPQFLVIPLVMALVYKKWSTLSFFLVTSIALTFVTAWFFSWHTLLAYPTLLAGILQGYTTGKYQDSLSTYITLIGPLCAILPRIEAQKIMSIVTVLGLSIICWLWSLTAKARDTNGAFALALTMLLLLVCSAHGLYYDLLLLAVPWAATIQTANFPALIRIKNNSQMIWCSAFMLFPAINWLIRFSKIDGGPSHVPILIILMLPAFVLWRDEIANSRSASAAQ
jgi:hypothetical protein